MSGSKPPLFYFNIFMSGVYLLLGLYGLIGDTMFRREYGAQTVTLISIGFLLFGLFRAYKVWYMYQQQNKE